MSDSLSKEELAKLRPLLQERNDALDTLLTVEDILQEYADEKLKFGTVSDSDYAKLKAGIIPLRNALLGEKDSFNIRVKPPVPLDQIESFRKSFEKVIESCSHPTKDLFWMRMHQKKDDRRERLEKSLDAFLSRVKDDPSAWRKFRAWQPLPGAPELDLFVQQPTPRADDSRPAGKALDLPKGWTSPASPSKAKEVWLRIAPAISEISNLPKGKGAKIGQDFVDDILWVLDKDLPLEEFLQEVQNHLPPYYKDVELVEKQISLRKQQIPEATEPKKKNRLEQDLVILEDRLANIKKMNANLRFLHKNWAPMNNQSNLVKTISDNYRIVLGEREITLETTWLSASIKFSSIADACKKFIELNTEKDVESTFDVATLVALEKKAAELESIVKPNTKGPSAEEEKLMVEELVKWLNSSNFQGTEEDVTKKVIDYINQKAPDYHDENVERVARKTYAEWKASQPIPSEVGAEGPAGMGVANGQGTGTYVMPKGQGETNVMNKEAAHTSTPNPWRQAAIISLGDGSKLYVLYSVKWDIRDERSAGARDLAPINTIEFTDPQITQVFEWENSKIGQEIDLKKEPLLAKKVQELTTIYFRQEIEDRLTDKLVGDSAELNTAAPEIRFWPEKPANVMLNKEAAAYGDDDVAKGVLIELEHTQKDKRRPATPEEAEAAKKIAHDHLKENPHYYDEAKLKPTGEEKLVTASDDDAELCNMCSQGYCNRCRGGNCACGCRRPKKKAEKDEGVAGYLGGRINLRPGMYILVGYGADREHETGYKVDHVADDGEVLAHDVNRPDTPVVWSKAEVERMLLAVDTKVAYESLGDSAAKQTRRYWKRRQDQQHLGPLEKRADMKDSEPTVDSGLPRCGRCGKPETTYRPLTEGMCEACHMKVAHGLDKEALLIIAKVVKRQDGWYVVSEKGKNLDGPYPNEKAAKKRLQQVEMFKHMKKGGQEESQMVFNIGEAALLNTKVGALAEGTEVVVTSCSEEEVSFTAGDILGITKIANLDKIVIQKEAGKEEKYPWRQDNVVFKFNLDDRVRVGSSEADGVELKGKEGTIRDKVIVAANGGVEKFYLVELDGCGTTTLPEEVLSKAGKAQPQAWREAALNHEELTKEAVIKPNFDVVQDFLSSYDHPPTVVTTDDIEAWLADPKNNYQYSKKDLKEIIKYLQSAKVEVRVPVKKEAPEVLPEEEAAQLEAIKKEGKKYKAEQVNPDGSKVTIERDTAEDLGPGFETADPTSPADPNKKIKWVAASQEASCSKCAGVGSLPCECMDDPLWLSKSCSKCGDEGSMPCPSCKKNANA